MCPLLKSATMLIEVLATSGDNHLGGDDFDERIVQYLVEQFKKTEGITCLRIRQRFSG